MFLVESLVNDGLSACSISSIASSALVQDFLALAGKKSMRGARQDKSWSCIMSFGVKTGECTGRLLLEEDNSVEDKSTVEPPTLCWLSGLVAEKWSKSKQSVGSSVLQGGESPCCDSLSSAGGVTGRLTGRRITLVRLIVLCWWSYWAMSYVQWKASFALKRPGATGTCGFGSGGGRVLWMPIACCLVFTNGAARTLEWTWAMRAHDQASVTRKWRRIVGTTSGGTGF